MCRLYERENCPHLDYLKDTLPKFKKSRPKVTYEDPLTPIMEALPVQISPNSKPLPQNDDLVEAFTAKYNPQTDGRGLTKFRVPNSTMDDKNTVEIMAASLLETTTFHLPALVECNNKSKTNK